MDFADFVKAEHKKRVTHFVRVVNAGGCPLNTWRVARGRTFSTVRNAANDFTTAST